jgi:dTDP-4-amino-4,6-dideoxygalactose transaminase
MTPPKKIWLSSPHMSGRELPYVQEAFAGNWIAPLGPNVDAFERELCAATGAAHAAALSSGTAALHLALVMLDVGPGDVVLCQTFTFSASANPIVYQGATPVFIDSEPDTWNLSPEALEEALRYYASRGKRPKAVIGVHLYGMPAKIDEILAICARYEVPFVEDAAEALGATYRGQNAGTFGRLSVLSFNGNKIITTSGGGALLSAEESLVTKARFLATQARDAAPHYEHSQIGYNYRMSNVCAGIGRGQLEVLAERVAQRRANFEQYHQKLSGLPGLSFQPEAAGSFSNRWLTGILIDPVQTRGITSETVRLALEKENIEARPLWKPMHMQPVFAEAPYFGGSVAAELFANGLCLPSGSNLSPEDLSRVSTVIRKAFV